MVLVAPRSAKLVDKQGARLTMLTGYVFVFLPKRAQEQALLARYQRQSLRVCQCQTDKFLRLSARER